MAKTVSGHAGYDYCASHNNRTIPCPSADPARTQNNIYLVAQGEHPFISSSRSACIVYADYNAIIDVYQRNPYDPAAIDALLRNHPAAPDNSESLLSHLLHVIIAPVAALRGGRMRNRIQELANTANKISASVLSAVPACTASLRDILYGNPISSNFVHTLDEYIAQAQALYRYHMLDSDTHFADIEQIYNKLFEDAHRVAQDKLKPCRRFAGSCLEHAHSTRAKKIEAARRKSGPGAATDDIPNDAFEIVFTIGNKLDTGYINCPEDAAKSEDLLSDFVFHLLTLPNTCVMTSRELADPNWRPPFSHGLILYNLAAHFDEETPGIHATFIPYATGITRGASIQPSRKQAFAGMGYDYSRVFDLDTCGYKIQKTDRDGNPKYDKNGNPCYKWHMEGDGVYGWSESLMPKVLGRCIREKVCPALADRSAGNGSGKSSPVQSDRHVCLVHHEHRRQL